MRKIVVVSTNENPDYMFYAPYVEKAWNRYGWTLCVMVTHGIKREDLALNNPESIVIELPKVEGVRDITTAQAGRLYAANHLPGDALIMTSDMDLIPLSNYWNPNPEAVTVYGHDLTWFSFYPMGYVAMIGDKWKKYIGLTGDTATDMKRDADELQMPYSEDHSIWWDYDWTLLTQRLKPHAANITFVNRGQVDIAGATLAKGRVDRYNWEATQNQPEWIDAHCENNNVRHPDKLGKFLAVYEKIHGAL